MFTVNGKELEYDIFDLEKAELFDKEMNTVVEKMNALSAEKEQLSFSESVRRQCEAVAECFDHLFGPESAARIFDGKVNLVLALTSFGELVDGINAQKSQIERMANNTAAKYTKNRAARRNKR